MPKFSQIKILPTSHFIGIKRKKWNNPHSLNFFFLNLRKKTINSIKSICHIQLKDNPIKVKVQGALDVVDSCFTSTLGYKSKLMRGEMCYKGITNWMHKVRLVSQYNTSPMAMGRTPPKGLIMVKRRVVPRICVIQHGMWPCARWKQSLHICGNPLTKSFGWKKSWRCSKTIPKWPFANKCNMH